MKLFRCAMIVGLVFASTVSAQEPTKPGPEHAMLKKMEGTWDATIKGPGGDSKGVAKYKMGVGGLWLEGDFEAEMGGMKFVGKGLDSYDPMKKKFTSVWVDSMAGSAMVFEGTHDADKKTTTMVGDAPGLDGKPAKWKSVNEFKDDDTNIFTMYVGDAKEPMMTITYKRRK